MDHLLGNWQNIKIEIWKIFPLQKSNSENISLKKIKIEICKQ
jgi:hypothetical protein